MWKSLCSISLPFVACCVTIVRSGSSRKRNDIHMRKRLGQIVQMSITSNMKQAVSLELEKTRFRYNRVSKLQRTGFRTHFTSNNTTVVPFSLKLKGDVNQTLRFENHPVLNTILFYLTPAKHWTLRFFQGLGLYWTIGDKNGDLILYTECNRNLFMK